MKSSWIKARAALSVPLSAGLHRWNNNAATMPHSVAFRPCSSNSQAIIRLAASSPCGSTHRSSSVNRPSLCTLQPVAQPRSSHVAGSRAVRLATSLSSSFLHPAGSAGVPIAAVPCRPPRQQLTVASGAASAGQSAVPREPQRAAGDVSVPSGNGGVSEIYTSIREEVEGSIWQGGKRQRVASGVASVVEEEVVVVGDVAAGAGRSQQSYVPLEPTPMVQEAWDLLNASVVHYYNQPVGTVAASDPTSTAPLNYDQVFIRDFIPSALAFMLSGHHEIVRNFLLYTLQLQSWEKTVDAHRPGEGLMPASFKVTQTPVEDSAATGGAAYEEHLDPDFGESAIGRVAPVDSGLWWIQLLQAYGRCTGDLSLQQRVDVQTGIKLILKVCLADHFDMFPTLITTDGSCMIDRRLGIHGHPLEIQSLLYGALRAARDMLIPEGDSIDLIRAVNARLTALSFHIRQYYWLDLPRLNTIYRFKTEEYSHDAVNKFNIYPDQIPPWLMDWIPDRGGYFVGNVQPAHMDFRWFALGNLWAIVSSLASHAQAEAILDLMEEKWEELVGGMPMKICFPALENGEWRIITGADPKNTAWSYHNGGSWPVLLWPFTAACLKMGRPQLAQRAVEVAERRLQADRWPEYYDTRRGRFIGKQARLHQTWSIAGYLTSKLLLANPHAVSLIAADEDWDIINASTTLLASNPRRRRHRPNPLPSPLF
ncbi:hypothetical protein CLOM_g10170 [Closterium sp. NIES-68]|nr:hypothetical protein CLOM_g10170 [Closterium sp. NIES-68]GJP62411.1 hypothetical protein CLOP_g19479 [Closterium sp. NIES-67]